MKYLLVLSHLMSKDCELGTESIARCMLAIERFANDKYDFLITMGWAYRVDCKTPISYVVRDFILANSEIDHQSIVTLSSSRDTVGDAYFCLEHLQNINLGEIHIVTSDYHQHRTTLIFNKIFNNKFNIKVFGAKTDSSNNDSVLLHEKESIDAFNKTFALTDFSSIKSIYNTLSTDHPLYNGKKHPPI